MRKINLDDPEFPHGELTGYKNGCRERIAPCPAEVTCTDRMSANARERRARGNGPANGRVTRYVQKRLTETLEGNSLPQVAATSGLSVEVIAGIHEGTHEKAKTVRMDEDYAEPLDYAWARLTRGENPRSVTEHGTGIAYSGRCCRCAKCGRWAASSRQKSLMGVRTEHAFTPDPDLPAYVLALHDAAGTWPAVGKLTGLTGTTLRKIATSTQPSYRARTVRAVRAVTVEQARAHKADYARVNKDRAVHITRTLNALGYSSTWINDQLGRQRRTVVSGKTVSVALLTRLEALAERIGDRPASDADGLALGARTYARTVAARHGYYPPAFYDDNDHLDVRSIPGHPWSKLDERAARKLAIAFAVAGGQESIGAVAHRLGEDKKEVERTTKRIGLYAPRLGEIGLHPDCKARAAWIRQMVYDYEDGIRGPVEVALRIGAVPNTVNATHPEVIAFRAALTIAHARLTAARINTLVARYARSERVAA